MDCRIEPGNDEEKRASVRARRSNLVLTSVIAGPDL